MEIILPSPQNPNFTQPNKGELFGSLYASYNLDLQNNKGKIKLSQQLTPMLELMDDESVISTPITFAKGSFDGATTQWYSIWGALIFRLIGSTWTLDNTAGSPTTNAYRSDMCKWDAQTVDTLIVTLATSVSKLVSGTWTANYALVTLDNFTGANHPVCSAFNGLILIGNTYKVVSINTAGTKNDTCMILPSNYWVEWIKSSSNGVWVGAKNVAGGEAKVFYWNGSDSNYTQGYVIPSSYVFSGIIGRDNVPYCINAYGQLLRFNGSSFAEVARLPMANSKRYSLTGYAVTDGFQPIHRNGMCNGEGDEILIMVNAGLNGTMTKLLENQLSGVWSYTPDNGLVHKHAISKNYDTNAYDYGAPAIFAAGALQALPKSDGSFYAGASLYPNVYGTGDKKSVLSSLDTTDTTKNKMGYLITSKIYSSEIDETWQNITNVFKPFLAIGDSIITKYRFIKKYDDQASQAVVTGTWVSAITFTVASVGDLVVGDEIEILSGRGSGLSAKITDITGTTITIDTSFAGYSSTFTFRSEGWIKINTFTDLQTQFKKNAIGKKSTQVQFKIILSGKGDSPELERIIISSQSENKT